MILLPTFLYCYNSTAARQARKVQYVAFSFTAEEEGVVISYRGFGSRVAWAETHRERERGSESHDGDQRSKGTRHVSIINNQ